LRRAQRHGGRIPGEGAQSKQTNDARTSGQTPHLPSKERAGPPRRYGLCNAVSSGPPSRRSRERDPRRESCQLLVLCPGWTELSPQLVDPPPQLISGEAERRLALLPDRTLRDGDRVEPARLGSLQQGTLIVPS